MPASVTLVIPGRNCAATIGACLDAVVPMLETTPLEAIVFVDDGSTDETHAIASTRSAVRVIEGTGAGAGAARNLGWRAATSPLVWFIDADCVAEPDALTLLLPHLADPDLGGVGGSYGNMTEDALLACLIHEEILERHRGMPARVNFLASFNVLYRRSVLEAIGGFDERFLKAQDAELAFRVLQAGHALGFELRSRVRHFHPTRLGAYLRTQRQQGYWRAWLYITRRGRARGDSYSSLVDHVQPPLAMGTLAALPLAAWPPWGWIPAAAGALGVLVLQVPMTFRLVRRCRHARYLAYAPLGFVRAFLRGVGLATGTVAALTRGR